MKKIIIAAFFIIFPLISTVLAETSIKAEADKTSLTTDQALTYRIIIASTEKNIPMPQLPKFDKFAVLSSSRSSSFSFANNEMKTVVAFAFILLPNELGKLKIEPCVIKIKDKTYSSEAIEIKVTQGKRALPAPIKKAPSSPQKAIPESGQPQISL